MLQEFEKWYLEHHGPNGISASPDLHGRSILQV
jgi:hypothetical protein